MKEYENFKTELRDKILWVQLNRPEKKNAFSPKLVEELHSILLEVGELFEKRKPRVRVVIIGTVMDDIFCSGADVQWFSKIRGAHDGRQASIYPQYVFAEIERLPVPVIAAVKGLCLTAGLEMAMCCDFIFAADNAKLGQVETNYALTPFGGGTQRLTRLVGPQKAREMIYLSRVIKAQEALSIGLVTDVAPLDQLDARVEEFAKKIISKRPSAIRRAKNLISLATYTNPEGFRFESIFAGEEFASGEPMEVVMEFLSKSREKSKEQN